MWFNKTSYRFSDEATATGRSHPAVRTNNERPLTNSLLSIQRETVDALSVPFHRMRPSDTPK
ncbi:hypothetical protein HAL_31380 [Haladaptatus sp. T7]|nr:hypothetical protein HAL_31380 [Haladaptatus sp. T7]